MKNSFIGQSKLLSRVDSLVSQFPRFTIIAGPKKSGKRKLANYIANLLEAHIVDCSLKVDDVREVIKLSYKQSEPTIYLLAGADKMSIAAKNALLKVTEEPPRQAYFIMTLEDLEGTLDTLKSRGNVLKMEPYTPNELIQYTKEVLQIELNKKEIKILADICRTPGDVELLLNYSIPDFYDYVETVIFNIGEVNGANAFKIGSRLAYKDGDVGWDVKLFLRTIMVACRNLMDEEPLIEYQKSILVTSKYLTEMSNVSVNKGYTFDMWVLEMRGIWVKD